MSAKVTSSTARKVIGSLGVIGAAAAVAGMGTFGSFTDSTAPVNTTIASGTVKINLTQAAALPFSAAGLVPGDSITRTFTLKNDGNTNFGSISVESTTSNSPQSVLTSDITNGLQLAVKSCSVPWTQSGNAFTCSAVEKSLASGPAVTTQPLAAPAALTSGAQDNIAITYTLPTGAGNTFQGKSADLSVVFTATQRAAGAR
ncbi:TasA family protein [Blastococcus sp. SYSU D01042]